MELPFPVNPKNESVDIYAYRSEKIDELLEAKLNFLDEISPIGRDSNALRGKYASLKSLMSHSQSALKKNFLSVDQIDLPYYFDPSTYNGTTYLHTILTHTKSKQWIKSINPYPTRMLEYDPTPTIGERGKKEYPTLMMVIPEYGKANTYIRRYVYKQILGIIIDDEYDEDGNNNNQQKKYIAPTQTINPYNQEKATEEVLTPQQVQVFHREFSGQTHIYEKIFERFKISKIDMVPRDKFNEMYKWAQEQKYK